MPCQICSPLCPNNSNIWQTYRATPEHWDGIYITAQEFTQEPAQSPPLTLSDSLLLHTHHITYTTFHLYFTAVTQFHYVLKKNLQSPLIIQSYSVQSWMTSGIPALNRSLMHMHTTTCPRTDTSANSLERLQHFDIRLFFPKARLIPDLERSSSL